MDTTIEFDEGSEPCACPEGFCASFVEPTEDCVFRLRGELKAHPCVNGKCQGSTWHLDGGCLRCKRELDKEQSVE